MATWAKPLRLPQRSGYVSSLKRASRTPPGEIPNKCPFFKARTHSSWGPWMTLNTSNSNLKPEEAERVKYYRHVWISCCFSRALEVCEDCEMVWGSGPGNRLMSSDINQNITVDINEPSYLLLMQCRKWAQLRRGYFWTFLRLLLPFTFSFVFSRESLTPVHLGSKNILHNNINRRKSKKQTWDLEEEVVAYRVAGPSFLNNDVCQKVIVVNGNGSMVIDYQCRSCVWDLLHSMNLIAWNSLTEQTIKNRQQSTGQE